MTFLAVAQGLSHGKPCFNSLGESHFFLSHSRDIKNIAFSLCASHEALFLSSVKNNTDYFSNVLRLCFIWPKERF